MPFKQIISVSRFLAAIFLLLPSLGFSQGIHPVSGRQIAPVMGYGGASWLVRAERQTEENPDLAVSLLGLKPGMMVADIGAGVGYYSFKMARKIAPDGKVYATDIQPEMLTALRKRMAQAKIPNIEPVLGKDAETGLPDGQLDLILLVDVYHELSEPQKMLASIARALKPNGRLALLEYRKEDESIPIRLEHKMSVATVRQELEAEGYRLIEIKEDLPWQHLFFFGKSKPQ